MFPNGFCQCMKTVVHDDASLFSERSPNSSQMNCSLWLASVTSPKGRDSPQLGLLGPARGSFLSPFHASRSQQGIGLRWCSRIQGLFSQSWDIFTINYEVCIKIPSKIKSTCICQRLIFVLSLFTFKIYQIIVDKLLRQVRKCNLFSKNINLFSFVWYGMVFIFRINIQVQFTTGICHLRTRLDLPYSAST